jgi:peptidoglycan hydrolase-like protein with peptidoglycan-binding domain
MKHSLRLTVLLTAFLVVAACGDDDAGTTTVPGETTVPTTAAETTTTAPVDLRPLAGLATMPVEDPLFGSGFHAMSLPDASGTIAVSTEPLVGGVADTNLLSLGTMDPYPVMSGVTADMLVVVAWVQNPSEDVLPDPSGVVLYGPSDQGWEALAAITDTIVLDYLKTTTDYAAWEPAEGVPYARTTVKSLDWTGSAHFVADVQVLDFPGNTTEFTAEIECTLAATLDCVLLSDDGVLRPGDEGDAVQQLESKLASIGYFPGGVPDAIYDSATADAVRVFQRDYRLGIDGKVGPQTAGLLDDIVAGTSNIVMAYQEGVEGVAFGTLVETALPALIAELGPPDYTLGWEMGPCGPTPPYGGWEWYKVTWGGFTAWFTEHDGPRQFDGWEVTDLSDVPSNLYFVGGIAPGWTWSKLAALGATYDEFYGWWYLNSLEYRQGTFVVSPPGNPPPNSAQILGWGVGTASVLYDC